MISSCTVKELNARTEFYQDHQPTHLCCNIVTAGIFPLQLYLYNRLSCSALTAAHHISYHLGNQTQNSCGSKTHYMQVFKSKNSTSRIPTGKTVTVGSLRNAILKCQLCPWCTDIQRKHPTHVFLNGYKEMPKLSVLPAAPQGNRAACYTHYYVSCIANADI